MKGVLQPSVSNHAKSFFQLQFWHTLSSHWEQFSPDRLTSGMLGNFVVSASFVFVFRVWTQNRQVELKGLNKSNRIQTVWQQKRGNELRASSRWRGSQEQGKHTTPRCVVLMEVFRGNLWRRVTTSFQSKYLKFPRDSATHHKTPVIISTGMKTDVHKPPCWVSSFPAGLLMM